jgi:hypothetical protein
MITPIAIHSGALSPAVISEINQNGLLSYEHIKKGIIMVYPNQEEGLPLSEANLDKRPKEEEESMLRISVKDSNARNVEGEFYISISTPEETKERMIICYLKNRSEIGSKNLYVKLRDDNPPVKTTLINTLK